MIYKGTRTGRETSITVTNADEQPLAIRRDLFNYAPTMEWGHVLNESAQLALAILAEHAGPTIALTYHQAFKEEVIAKLPVEGWTLTTEEIDGWLRDQGVHV